DYAVNGRVQKRAGNGLPYAAPHNAFKCRPLHPGSSAPADERWLVIACFTDAEWDALVEAMGRPAWAKDGKFAGLAARKEHETELEQLINAWTADNDAYELMEELQRRGVPAGVVQGAREMLADEHLKERGYYVYLDHPETGRTAYDGPPFKLSKTPGELRSPAPLLGEHTEYVCKEILGLSDEEIADLLVAGVLQ
ncbi:unnamed protein product, partial [marine sediment metagenome]